MKNKRKAFWRNFKFKYKLTITNEDTLEEIVGIHVSKLNGVSVLLSAVTVIFLITAVIIAFTPLKNYLPGCMGMSWSLRYKLPQYGMAVLRQW